jgi:tripartite-type tricarboxylate transporter receptor subunit TctC
MLRLAIGILAGSAFALPLAALPASAQDDVAGFYRSKGLTLQVGGEAGGAYDLVGRLVARYLGKYVPGEPSVVVQNVPVGGGVQLLNQFESVAPRDGSVIGTALASAPLAALLTPQVAHFDPRKFSWIGGAGAEIITVAVSDKSPVQTLDQLYRKELIVGATSPGAASVDYPVAANAILGTKFKLVQGYNGAGVVVKIAMPAGEVDGCAAIVAAALKSQFQPELKSGKIRVLAQWGFTKDPDFPDAPLFPTGKTEADHQLFEILYARQDYGRPFFTPPDVPAARLTALRTAFERVFKDATFLDEVRKQNLDLDYVPGSTLTSMTDRVMGSPPEVVERIHAVLGF